MNTTQFNVSYPYRDMAEVRIADMGGLLPDSFDKPKCYQEFESRVVAYLKLQGWTFPDHPITHRIEDGVQKSFNRDGHHHS